MDAHLQDMDLRSESRNGFMRVLRRPPLFCMYYVYKLYIVCLYLQNIVYKYYIYTHDNNDNTCIVCIYRHVIPPCCYLLLVRCPFFLNPPKPVASTWLIRSCTFGILISSW